MSPRIHLTGFGPFLDVAENPSARLAEASGRPFHLLDVSYDAVEDFIFHLDPEPFDALLLMGVATSRAHLTPEIYARNHYGRTADVTGASRAGAIQEGSPLLLEGSLWTPDLLGELVSHHMRSTRISLDAGGYLCNFAYYKALAAFPSKRVGFLHVPPVEAMPLDRQREILQWILERLESGGEGERAA